jgi:hypothetical protein
MHNRFLTVPKNEEGIIEYDVGIECSDNFNVYILPDEEFNNLWDAFMVMNGRLGLLIDEYESEIIENIYLEKCKQILQEMKVDSPVFIRALEEAIGYNTILALDL